MKNFLKYFLNNKKIRDKLLNYYQPEKSYTENYIYKYFIDNNIWFFSQPKSGTTKICNIIAFYNSEIIGKKNYSFDDVPCLGIGRGLLDDFEKIEKLIIFKQKYNLYNTIHTHSVIRNAKPKFLLLSSRNVFDQCESAYHFFYVNRINVEDYDVDKALHHLTERFCNTYLMQKKIINCSSNVIQLDYDEIKLSTFDSMYKTINLIYQNVDKKKLELAIQNSDEKSVRQFEEQKGAPLSIAREGTFKGKSFIRSGVINMGIDFFTKNQIDYIEKKLKEKNIPTSGIIE